MFTFGRWIEEWGDMLGAERMTFGIVGVIFIIVFFLERDFGAEKGQTMKGRLRNILLGALYFILGYMVLAAFVVAASPSIDQFRSQLGVSILYCLIYLLAVDFLYYWYHRAQHSFRFLWAIHELHHADSELNITTSYRTYWLERLVQPVLISIPVFAIFGQNVTAIGMYIFIATSFLLFTHSNVRLQFGRWSPVLCGPQVHRIHHSRLPEHQDKNFAQIFPFYDVLFGTYWAPKKDEFPPTGTEGLASNASLVRDMVQPFVIWGGLIKSGARSIRSMWRGPDRQPIDR